MKPKANLRANLPLRGRCRRQKGCISIGRNPVVRFSIPRSGIIKLIARRAIPPPSGQRPVAPFYTTCAVRRAPFYFAAPAATTTLSHEVAVKPKNPKNLRPARAVNPHARQGVKNPRNRRGSGDFFISSSRGCTRRSFSWISGSGCFRQCQPEVFPYPWGGWPPDGCSWIRGCS